MAASFGEQLRLAREARGISLREISEQTRISIRYLEAIEVGDYKRLPGGIFNRSFIKAYAKYVGYNETEALDAYARAMKEQGESVDDMMSMPQRSRVYTDGNSTRSPLVTLALTVLILAILTLSVYAALHWYQRRDAAKTNANSNANAPVQQATNTNTAPNNSTATPAQNSSVNAARGLDVQIKARGEQVWVRAYVDDATKAAFAENLEPDQSKEFKPEQRLRIQSSKDKIAMIEVSINGRPAKVPVDNKGILAEMVITKEDYEKFLQ
ncbi:MAG: helix-turn-helix domain-containing protein [Pyrinomonadaceae bacterium]